MSKIKREAPREIKNLRDMVVETAKIHGEKDLYVYKENKEEVNTETEIVIE